MKKILYIAILGLVFLGFGCDRAKNTTVQKSVLDARTHIVGLLPESWGSVMLNTLYKQAKTPSGFGYVPGGSTIGFGPKDEKSGVLVVVQVIGIPKGFVDVFEKNKYPSTVTRLFDAGPYVMYVARLGKGDQSVDAFISSLEFKP